MVTIPAFLVGLLVIGGLLYLGLLFVRFLGGAIMSRQDTTMTQSQAAGALGSPLSRRFLVIAILALAMLLPLSLVEDIVQERHQLYDGVLTEIAASWGGRQTITGPLLIIPFIEEVTRQDTTTDAQGQTHVVSRKEQVRRQAVFLPDSLGIGARLNQEFRYRGIYQALVYTADMELTGRFPVADPARLSDALVRVEWDKASLAIGLPDTKAIRAIQPLEWGTARPEFAPGSRLPELIKQGFHAPLTDQIGRAHV
jgi:inner membrane protein